MKKLIEKFQTLSIDEMDTVINMYPHIVMVCEHIVDTVKDKGIIDADVIFSDKKMKYVDREFFDLVYEMVMKRKV